MYISLQGTESEKSVALLKALENMVGRKKGKGIKSRSCVKIIKVNNLTIYTTSSVVLKK
jgi:hypothetical protein